VADARRRLTIAAAFDVRFDVLFDVLFDVIGPYPVASRAMTLEVSEKENF